VPPKYWDPSVIIEVRHIVGQHIKTIDFTSVLDGKIFLVNLDLQSTISMDDQQLLGTLLLNELMTAAFARPRGQRREFYLCIDEAQRFVTKDLCEILDGARKFGLHVLLAHQHLNQFRLKDPEVYYSALTNARTKVIFGGIDDEDADVFAKRFGQVNLKEIKDEIWRTTYVPVESPRLIVGESDSEGGGHSYSSITHESIASGQVFINDSVSWPMSENPVTTTASAASGTGTTEGEHTTWAHSRSETLVPWYEYHAKNELATRAFYSLEEQLYKTKDAAH
jgi:hypothetical protein